MPGKTHQHILTPGLISILAEIIWAVKRKDKNCVHIQRDLNLTHSQFCNLQKLKYWNLITHYKENGERKAGFWLITLIGGRFLRNEISISYKVTTFDNSVIARSPEQRMIKDFYPAYSNVWFQTNWGSGKISNQMALAF